MSIHRNSQHQLRPGNMYPTPRNQTGLSRSQSVPTIPMPPPPPPPRPPLVPYRAQSNNGSVRPRNSTQTTNSSGRPGTSTQTNNNRARYNASRSIATQSNSRSNMQKLYNEQNIMATQLREAQQQKQAIQAAHQNLLSQKKTFIQQQSQEANRIFNNTIKNLNTQLRNQKQSIKVMEKEFQKIQKQVTRGQSNSYRNIQPRGYLSTAGKKLYNFGGYIGRGFRRR